MQTSATPKMHSDSVQEELRIATIIWRFPTTPSTFGTFSLTSGWVPVPKGPNQLGYIIGASVLWGETLNALSTGYGKPASETQYKRHLEISCELGKQRLKKYI